MRTGAFPWAKPSSCSSFAISPRLNELFHPLRRRGCRAKPASANRARPRCIRGFMSVDANTVRRIARLARIAVADAEVEHLRGELNSILAFVEQLNEVDVAGVEPMTSVTPMAMKKRAHARGPFFRRA